MPGMALRLTLSYIQKLLKNALMVTFKKFSLHRIFKSKSIIFFVSAAIKYE